MAKRIAKWIGLVTIGVGAYFPWVMQNPQYISNEIRPRPIGLDSGLEIWGAVILVLVVAAIVGMSLQIRWIGESKYQILVSITSLVFAGSYIIQWGVVGEYYIVGSGILLTIVGSVILLIGNILEMGNYYIHQNNTSI